MPPIEEELQEAQAEAKQPKTVAVAIVDAKGVYQGKAEKLDTELVEGDFVVPLDCDLPAGRYKRSADGKRFDPLAPEVRAPALPPDCLLALYALARVLDAQGTPLHAATRAWMDTYGKTVDAQGLKF